jgi:chromatin remodeling complex protein RSC6
MSSFADAIHAQINTPYALSPAMEQFVGRRTANRREVMDAIRAYATDNGLYRENRYVVKPDLLLGALLSHRAPFHIKDTNALIAPHLTSM